MATAGFIPRTCFPAPTVPRAYFLGHHAKAIRKMRELTAEIDLIYEVRDARAPLSTRNMVFDSIIGAKPRVVVYTKKDLSAVNPDIFRAWHSRERYCVVNTHDHTSVRRLVSVSKELCSNRESFSGLRVMIMGMPNVGKSSLLNTLRHAGVGRRKAAKTGALAGVTRNISSYVKIHEEPDIFVYDTPGVSLPKTINAETMLTLSTIGSINVGLIDPTIQADYLLYQLNLVNPDGSLYNKYSPPTNDVEDFLTSYCIRMHRLSKRGYPDLLGAAAHWVDRWRKGLEGKIAFDDFRNPNAYKEWEAAQDERRRKERGQQSDQKFRVA
ncbi:P-loop containing nucleoside triphosphate hydrolase protein [Lipomyces orientalis]|uniref:P-loop containing nucleoside triphosphate hydrolase protein n=1 Tax=Lipomyces orientalis TaxID=1233043 RepID=A0ACC3TI02_9ASCO